MFIQLFLKCVCISTGKLLDSKHCSSSDVGSAILIGLEFDGKSIILCNVTETEASIVFTCVFLHKNHHSHVFHQFNSYTFFFICCIAVIDAFVTGLFEFCPPFALDRTKNYGLYILPVCKMFLDFI